MYSAAHKLTKYYKKTRVVNLICKCLHILHGTSNAAHTLLFSSRTLGPKRFSCEFDSFVHFVTFKMCIMYIYFGMHRHINYRRNVCDGSDHFCMLKVNRVCYRWWLIEHILEILIRQYCSYLQSYPQCSIDS